MTTAPGSTGLIGRIAGWVSGLALLAAPSWAQSSLVVEKPSLTEGWHTVRPGDTLEDITRHYLGTAERWRENWDLNKELLEDPHKIYPGQRIRVLLEERLPVDGALLYRKERTVEDQLLPFEWRLAELNDLLRPSDQVRTLENASAGLLFFDDTHLILTEQSLVIVGEGTAPEPEVESAQIEIVLGQADLAARSPATESREIEIVIGTATSRPRPTSAGSVATRARRPAAGGAQVMAYEGDNEVVSGGALVRVPQGMGSAVPEGEPPGEPEKLLDPPSDRVPAPGSRPRTPRPEFSWSAVPGALSYTVEICRDPSCARLVERATSLTDTGWQPSRLEIADYYWRVTAVSASGLDGYPSPPVPFSVLAEEKDRQPPVVTVRFVGPQDAPRAGLNERLIVGPGITIEIDAEDAGGIRGWTPFLDGREVLPERLQGPWTRGEHSVAATAVDGAGNRATTPTVEFIYDPDPPRFRWGLEGRGGSREVPGFFYTTPESPAPERRGRQRLAAGGREWLLDSDFTQVILRPAEGKRRVSQVGEALRPRQGLWILAEDDVCPRVEKLAYDLVESVTSGPDRGGPYLVVEATDCVGNRSRIEWPLATAGS